MMQVDVWKPQMHDFGQASDGLRMRAGVSLTYLEGAWKLRCTFAKGVQSEWRPN